ncbi:hypothetical protein [Clostridium sp. JS66]|uniref:hypothetical protein n=1 Tax=Clostridium sp. JS66 TaxID=3064705 RepID=UPI00298E656A|nr:hypothetical protein [Clostridium sp. JS66]WPC40857.1 hypothetical protein Q6H37_23630 [Clostridium sp. JS66]
MLQLAPLEFFLRSIPESILLIFVSYLFAGKKINKKYYFISTIIFAVIAYLVRKLPINFGVHTIISILMYIIVNVSINKIPIDKAISSVLSGIILLSICEWINLFILNDYLKVNIQVMMNHPMMKILYMMPSLILFMCFIWLLYIFAYKNKKEDSKNVFN